MTSAVASRRIERRAGRRRERAAMIAIAAVGVLLLAPYVVGLVYLLARGAPRLLSFAVHALPASGVEGEGAYRFVLASVIFGTLAWGVVRVVRAVLAWRKRPLAKVADRVVRAAPFALAAGGALAFRDHLPRFLLAMPSETSAGGGIGPELFNTVYFAILSTLVTLPLGVGAALYLARFARKGPLLAAVRGALDTLAALPSIVYGLFGFLVFVVMLGAGYSLFAGALALALLNLPLVVAVSEEALRSVPRELEEASLALGATPVQTALRVAIPYAWPGILGAIVLAVGRVLAESAPLILTAGTTVSRATAYSLDPFRGGETLAVHLWYVNSAGLAPDRAEVSAATAALLVVLAALSNVVAARAAHWGRGPGARRKGS